MIKAKVDNMEYNIEIHSTTNGSLNGKEFTLDVLPENNHRLHAIINNASYNIEIFKSDVGPKSFRVKVNGSYYDVELSDRYDELLKDLGMEAAQGALHKDLKAPMPGLVLEVITGAGTQVNKGDAVVILEAMKMENVIKSPVDGIIKHVAVSKGQAVEKNEVLVEFE